MKLRICNLGKVKNAEIDVDGLTVIAGSNNTGKSTVGKVIFSVYNSLNDIENKIITQRIATIGTLCRNNIRNALSHRTVLGELQRPISAIVMNLSREITRQITDDVRRGQYISIDIFKEIFFAFFSKHKISIDIDEINELVNTVYSESVEVLQLSEKTIAQAIVSRYFARVFNDQINALQNGGVASVNLELKNRMISIDFANHKCASLDMGISILHKAIYIDNPFIIDQLDDESYISGENFLADLINSQYDVDDDQVIEAVLAEEKMDEIFNMLSSVVNGRILIQNGDYFLEDKDVDQPISVKNLSSGLKSFVLLKMLVESGLIRNKDVLILDEPEIHLHPEWQIVYAELIVLLQKHLNLSIIVTTHSPYFLDAIDLFSKKHKIESKTNYYLSKVVDTQAEFQKVSDCVDAIYKEMASPIDVLETLRYELTEE